MTIRRLLGILLGSLGILVAALFLVTTLQLQGADVQARAENRRNESFLVAESMRQSSDDLTLMVRLYVSTGQPRYREFYDEILAIRAGTAPRPLGYDGSFWDRVMAEGKGFVRYGPPKSLRDQMREADFTEAEFNALDASLTASNDLATLEVDVMNRVEKRIAQGVGSTYPADIYPDYRLLADANYLAEKGVIMQAIGDFIALVEERTRADVERARSGNRNLFAAQLAILGLVVLISVASLAVVTRVVLRPLDELTSTSRRVADGDYRQRAEIRSVSELERVAGAFNEMAQAVEADIAGRQRAERVAVEARQAAEQASVAKSSFLAAMSHEIRTPMIGVTGMLEVLAQTPLTAQQRHMVSTAQGSAAALLQIIGDVLDFSKIEAGKLEITPSTFALRPVVEAATSSFFHTASAKGLLISWSADERLAPAYVGDPLRIRQILNNFLSNSVKFTDVGGIEVTIRVLDRSIGADTVELAVTDTGPGVTPEQQERLFQEFNQAGTSTAERSGGTGLGLVICRRLANLMGGDVTMASTVGKGTTMRLVLPMPVGDPADLDQEAAPRSVQAASRPKPSRDEAERERSLVLLAEDHPVNRTVLCHQLDIIGFHVDTAPDGQEGLEMFRSGRYGLVLTDINMPRLTGYELATAIRRHEEEAGWGRTPILALTANVMQGEPEKCLAAGMDDFVAKPTTIPFLASKLRQWLPQLSWPAEPAPVSLEGGGASAGGGAGAASIDSSVLDELTGGDAELVTAVLQDFVETSRIDLRTLDEALSAGDLAEVRREAHRMKGAALLVGAKRMADLAQQIETRAADGSADGDPLVALAGQLSEALEAVAGAATAVRS
jgi:signal transduction histidine kinase/CheY-like chemotaxis protein/HPt (histidine-containing phosphotransfer) domain-containing protein